MVYSAQIERLARAYNLTPASVIFCHAAASGAPMGDAYGAIFRTTSAKTPEQGEELARDFLTNNPGAKVLINKLKSGKAARAHQQATNNEGNDNNEGNELTDEERDEFCTKSGLVRKIVTSIKGTAGKDRVAALVTLAKLQGLDKPDEGSEEERRRYFLPWVSRCRNCELMRIYAEICVNSGK